MVSDLKLAAHILIGLIIIIATIMPWVSALIISLCLLAAAGGLYFVYIFWETARPNEWMIIIDNGKQA